MENERYLFDILWRIDCMCDHAIRFKDEGANFWTDEKQKPFVKCKEELQVYLNNYFINEKPDEYRFQRVKSYIDRLEKTVCKLFDTWRAFEPYNPKPIINLIGVLSNIQGHIRKELEFAQPFIQEQQAPGEQPAEQTQTIYTDAEKRFMSYFDEKEASSKLAEYKHKIQGHKKQKDVYEPFFALNPNIKSSEPKKIAEMLFAISGRKINESSICEKIKKRNNEKEE